MALSPDDNKFLATFAQQLLQAFALVESAAERELRSRHGSDLDVFALPQNPMVGNRQASSHLNRIQQGIIETLINLKSEPFIVHVVAEDDNGQRHSLYFARTNPLRNEVTDLDGRLVSYRATLGRLAEVERGDEIDLRLPNGCMATYTIIERVRLRPRNSNAQWDGLINQIEAQTLLVTIDSLRDFLAQLAAAEIEPKDFIGEILQHAQAASAVIEGVRRSVIDRMSLRDQPVLDRYQGEIFRLPLDRRLILTGPAGTGKTTTLIRRLAQKRNVEDVDEEERERVPAGFFHPNNWIMFTPTTLLKLYLKEAFAREGVAASDDRVRTWSDERRRLSRDVFKILRSERGGRFTLDDDAGILLDSSSQELMGLVGAVDAFFREETVAEYDTALEALVTSADPELVSLGHRMRRSIGDNSIAFERLSALGSFKEELSEYIRKRASAIGEVRRKNINIQLTRDRRFLERLADFLDAPALQSEEEDEDDDIDSDDEQLLSVRDRQVIAERALWRAIVARAVSFEEGRSIAPNSRNSRILEWLGIDPANEPQFQSLGSALLSLRRLRFLSGTFRNLVERLPIMYQRFRRAALKGKLVQT